jgi:hypothetical protein
MAGDLRYCMNQAADRDSIQFDVKGTINLTGALPNLTHSISIEGPGPDLLTVRRDTGGLYRIFTVAGGTTISISELTVANGNVSGSSGGGILNFGTLTVTNSMISENQAHEYCDDGCVGGDGGGIQNYGTLTINNSTVNGNTNGNTDSSGDGGGIYNSGTLTLNNSTISGNTGYSSGGIHNYFGGRLIVSNSTISGNTGHYAGGIENLETLTVSNSTLSGNVADGRFGGSDGGGIYSGGTLTVSDSTITGNSVGGGAGLAAGGIYVYGTSSLTTVMVLNSTVSNNTVSGSDQTASQIFNGRLGPVLPAPVQLRNTIISGDGRRPNILADHDSTFVSQGHNLSSDDGSGFLTGNGDLINTDPLLGPL